MSDVQLLSLTDIQLTFGGDALFSGVTFGVSPSARIALVGRNGCGKSTLLKIAAGSVTPDDGERFLHPGVAVSYLPQEPDLSGSETALDHVLEGLPESGDAHSAQLLLVELGVAPDARTDALSGGEAKRVAIARAFASEPDIFLLDEPTNHLDLYAIEWLEQKLRTTRAAFVLISHDRRFLETLSDTTVWIDRGIARTLPRGFAHFEAWRDQTLEEEEAAHHKLGRKIVAEEHWMRYGVTARRKRNMRRVKELAELRQNLKEGRRKQATVKMTATETGASGKQVIVADKISKSFGDTPLIKDFSVKIARGDKIGIVGPNGAGKTTLLNLLTGALAPDEGTISLGTNLDIVTLEQRRSQLKPEMRLADAITDGRGDFVTVGGAKKHVASYLKDFLFGPEQWRSPVSALSGGERGRLALAAALTRPSNLLVLDEPTNDLDLETLDLLQELLADYQGTLLLVSHDRSFLDRVVTSVITVAPEGGGGWRRYAGGYDDMVAQRGAAPTGAKLNPEAPKQAAPRAGAGKVRSNRIEKLSYKEKYALETLPGLIDGYTKEIEEKKALIEDPSLFQRDPDLFNSTAAALDETEQKLAAAEEEWLELEMKREEIDSAS